MTESISEEFAGKIIELLKETRSINATDFHGSGNILKQVQDLSEYLKLKQHDREASALLDVYHHCITEPDFGGLGYSPNDDFDNAKISEVLFFTSAYLEALNYEDRRSSPIQPLDYRPDGRRGMTLAEKIFASHDVSRKGEVKVGDVIRLDVDWVMASELSWAGMERTYNSMGKPGIFRNDRLWIAGDHVVDPRIMDHPKVKPFIEKSERARQVFKLTEYQGMNYTIMHTEFSRSTVQPGMLIVGSDSHTCSAGSVSCLAIGLGNADVALPLVTGETWIKVPETVEIRFINKPRPCIGGKDIILYVLKELKRNTVAAERVVEYTGLGLQYLSCDARFAICNMTTEFGGVTGICVPDEVTRDFIDKRKNPKHKKQALYYRPDEDAQYAETCIIDLQEVEPFVAKYPNPDDVVVVSEVAGTALNGCFIGACTTTQEDLILAALVLEAGLKRGMKPKSDGKRKVVPGSLPILHYLNERGLVDIYREAGFEIGVPGCSYCVGISADKAEEGEVWLSSQNRNFQNRMGPGSIGSITSAAVVAASSFNMTITDPATLLDDIDANRLQELLGTSVHATTPMKYVEPASSTTTKAAEIQEKEQPVDLSKPVVNETITGKVQTLGDLIDTDALAPSEVFTKNLTTEELGTYCLYRTHPDFRRRIKEDGHNIVVAGRAFGVGSSRENAVTALQGAGVKCVIARSFAFIYARNQPNLGMLGIVMNDEEFFELAKDGVEIEVDVDQRVIRIGEREWKFQLSELEIQLWQQGGMSKAFAKWGKMMLENMTSSPRSSGRKPATTTLETPKDDGLQW